VAADVGGTFTDIVATREQQAWVTKVPSTPDDPGRAVVEGVEEICRQADAPISEVTLLLHGTTIATNAVLQRRGARTALLTTRGFRDVLEIARQARPRLFDLDASRPEPLIPRALRLELSERLDASGNEMRPVDRAEVEGAVRTLQQHGVESIAVCLLHSYVNPEHEQAVAHVVHSVWRDVPISLSTDLVSEYREYERTSTTAINAFVAPAMRD
jgi:N-methylhydantoinase A